MAARAAGNNTCLLWAVVSGAAGHLGLPVRYFELLMQRMESDPPVGTTSGKLWFVLPQTGALLCEVCRARCGAL
jgi:hypothetical protein